MLGEISPRPHNGGPLVPLFPKHQRPDCKPRLRYLRSIQKVSNQIVGTSAETGIGKRWRGLMQLRRFTKMARALAAPLVFPRRA